MLFLHHHQRARPRFALSLESPQQLIGYAITRKAYGFPVDYWDKYPAQIAAISADDVQRVAKKYIDPGTMQVVAVGDASKIKTVLDKYGPVEIVAPSEKLPEASGKASGAGL
jgi:predicted Zn-dependent peptidase